MFERKTGKILTGPNAPTPSTLKAFIQRHPTFQVLQPGQTPGGPSTVKKPVGESVYLSIYLFIYLSICLLVSLSVCQAARLSIIIYLASVINFLIDIYVFLSIYLWLAFVFYLAIAIYLSSNIYICQAVYLSSHLSIYLSISI